MDTDFQLHGQPLIKTRDFEESTEFVYNLWRPYQAVKRLGNGNYFFETYAAFRPDIALARINTSGGLALTGGQLDDVYLLAIPLRGHFRFVHSTRQYDFSGQHSASLYSAGQYHEIGLPEPVELLNIRFSRCFLEGTLEDLLGRPMSQPLIFHPELDLTGSLGQQVLALLHYLKTALNSMPVDQHSESMALQQVERALMILLLQEQPHNYSAEMKSRDPDPANWQLLRAEEYVKSRLDHALNVADLARAAGVSERTLSSAFKGKHGCTPVQFIRQLRLDAVHHELQLEYESATVTEIATRWGFSHLGHFTENYRKQFAETPSQTRRKKARFFAISKKRKPTS